MRRAQSVRHVARPSLALGADDLGILREGDESNEDVLRRQLLDKDRECDKLQTMVQTLQAELAQRPSLEKVEEMRKEHKATELLLDGTLRENERCEAEKARMKIREQMLERELTKLAGENWQANLEIAPADDSMIQPARSNFLHQRSATLGFASPLTLTSPASMGATSANPPLSTSDQQRQLQEHITQVRRLMLGMEQRLQTREEKLSKEVERAEKEAQRFEELGKEMMVDS